MEDLFTIVTFFLGFAWDLLSIDIPSLGFSFADILLGTLFFQILVSLFSIGGGGGNSGDSASPPSKDD